MQIALISPKVGFTTDIEDLRTFWYTSKEAEPYRNFWSGISSGLLTIAALTPKSIEIDFVDENFDEIDFDKSYDCVGITAMTQQITRAYVIAKEFKKRGIPVVFGGIHPTLLPDEVIKNCDAVVIGEAELIWEELINDLNKNQLKKMYSSKKEVDLTNSPLPRFDLINPKNYNLIWLQTSRGCPHDCEYCTSSKIFGPKYKNKKIDQILNEITSISEIAPQLPIAFADDNFFVNRKNSSLVMTELEKMNIRWHAQSDISVGEDVNLLNKMRRSGCKYLFIGFESITEDGLKNIDKNNWKFKQLKNYSQYIANIQSSGIGVMGAFIVGLDSDTLKVFDNLYNFIIENNLYAASITILTPFPGTRLRDRFVSENRILNSDWSKYTAYNVNFIPKNIKKEEIEENIVRLYTRVYSNETYLKKADHFKQIQMNLIKKGLI